jgi:hypothetical protein
MESTVTAFKIFGNHDDKTKQQMAQCMTVDESLYSTVHGAGRVMSRTEARCKRPRKTGEALSAVRGSDGRCQCLRSLQGLSAGDRMGAAEPIRTMAK